MLPVRCFYLVLLPLFLPPGLSGGSHPVDDKVVLRIAPVTITGYELEKNEKIFMSGFLRRNGHPPDSTDIKKWIDGFIDHTYFLADAYRKGYDTSREVERKVESMAHLIVSQPNGLTEQKIIQEQQGQQLKEIIKARYRKGIKDSAQIMIDQDLLTRLGKYIRDSGAMHTFDMNRFNDIADRKILTYTMDGRSVSVSLSGFMDYYNGLPIRSELRTEDDLGYYLESMVFDAYGWREAERSGITGTTQFLLDKENFKKSVVYILYEEQELKKGIAVTEAEITARYNAQKEQFGQATDVIVSYFVFRDRRSAAARMFALRTKRTGPADMEEPLDSCLHRTLNYQSRTFPDTIHAAIFNMKPGEVSRPIPWQGKFLVVIKEAETGSRIRNINEVGAILVHEIAEEKLEEKKKSLLTQLKASYPVTNDIDYQKYCSIHY